jgi:precorrin-6Y C5,15-methyltransferase (decarboxylating)
MERHEMPASIHIIGIGEDALEGLTKSSRQVLAESAWLVGPPSLLRHFPNRPGQQQHVMPSDLEELVEWLEVHADSTVSLLVQGDPLFYGIARFLCQRMGKDRFQVAPHVSSMQMAFARVKESWDEAYLTNLAHQQLESIADRIRTAEKVGIFTSDHQQPSRIAQFLIDRQLDYFTAYVCENLGAPDERVTRGDLQEIAHQSFAPLNVMILVRIPGTPDRPADRVGRRLFGNPDELFLHAKPKRGLLTPSEVRAIALAEMQLQRHAIVWDIGAGSGSVAIEAAMLADRGQVFAIEMDAEDFGLLLENKRRFELPNLQCIHGEAPQAWQGLPAPDAIFLGGTGRGLKDLANSAWPMLRTGGVLIANSTALEHVAALQTLMHDVWQVDPQLWMIQVSRSNLQITSTRMESMNPTFLLKATKR